MKQTTSFLVLSLICGSVRAQLLERDLLSSWDGSFERVLYTDSGRWVFVGNIDPIGSAAGEGFIIAMDTLGNYHWQAELIDPPDERVHVNALTWSGNNGLLIAGSSRPTCDTGMEQGWLHARTVNGDSLWTQRYATPPIEEVAAVGPRILASYASEVLVLSDAGDSLDQVSVALGDVRRLRAFGGHAFLACDQGIMVLDTVGAEVHSRALANGAVDFIAASDSTLACLSDGYLYLLDTTLATLDSVLHGAVGTAPLLVEDQGYLWVIGSDTARFFSPILANALSFPLLAPAGHSFTEAAVSPQVIMTSGSFHDGPLRSAVMRSIGKHGETLSNAPDAAIGPLSAEMVTITPTGDPGYFAVEAVYETWIKNVGPDPIEEVRSNWVGAPDGCAPTGIIQLLGGLALAPGDSIQVTIGGTYVVLYSPDTTAVPLSICLRITSPDSYMDRDTTNNESCVTITVPIGINEHLATPLCIRPNPATDHIWPGIPVSAARCGIMAMDGRVVWEGQFKAPDASIDIGSLAPGSYILRIEGEDGPRIGRFVRR